MSPACIHPLDGHTSHGPWCEDEPTMPDLPADAITAAAEVIYHRMYTRRDDARETAQVALEAAAPVLRAQGATAERARIREMAVDHDAIFTECNNFECAAAHGDIDEWTPFADLLDGDDHD